MADVRETQAHQHKGGDETSSLESLSRTLEALEARLSRITAGQARAAEPPMRSQSEAGERASAMRVPAQVAAGGPRPAPRAEFSDAVSQIVMRQRALNKAERTDETGSHEETSARETVSERGEGTVSPLPQREGGRYAEAAAMNERRRAAGVPDITAQLERLREELRADMAKSFQPRFDDMRAAVDDLRKMIAERASSEQIEAEIARVADGLSQMTGSGADQAGLQSLQSELDSIGKLVRSAAQEESLQQADRKWDDLRTTLSDRQAAETSERRDIKDELERLRSSLGQLASEEHVKAVERRWEEFEGRLLENTGQGTDAGLSDLLRTEMASLREKLETLASEQSVKAVEQRWGVLEERFASREIESKMEAMASRMEQLESALNKLPENFGLGPLEQRIQSLAEGLDVLGRRQQEEASDAQFQLLEDRLDEISRAIVAAANKVPTVDMSPVERVEARLQALTSRVDGLAEADTDAMSARIADLADRIESLSEGSAAAALTERIEAFSSQLDNLAGLNRSSEPDISALEARLKAIGEQIELLAVPRLDDEIVASLEAQVRQLTDRISEVGYTGAVSDPELNERLATIEFRLDESRESALESARAAADQAVKRILESGDSRQGDYVAQLTSDLRSLEEMSRQSGEQSQAFYEAMHATLLKLVDRIDRIEGDFSGSRQSAGASSSPEVAAEDIGAREDAKPAGGLRGMLSKRLGRRRNAAAVASEEAEARWDGTEDEGALDQESGWNETPDEQGPLHHAAAPSVSAPEFLDSQEANRPLAVGSGQPDVMSLVERVRAKQAVRDHSNAGGAAGSDGKEDFIAAARRAALAAAAEADAMRGGDTGEELSGRERLGEMLARRRKPIFLAISAVLLALMALPLGHVASTMMGGEEPVEKPAQTAKITPEAAEPNSAAEGIVATPDTVKREVASNSLAAKDSPPDVAGKAPLLSPAALPESNNGFKLPDGVATPKPETGRSQPQGVVETGDSPAAADVVDEPAADSASVGMSSNDLPSIPEGVAPEALMEAAKAREPKALFEIGLRLMEGRAGEPDPKAAAQWFTLSADAGFAPAQYSLGTLYEKGNGVERDPARARDFYLAAAEGGNVRAMHNLAVLYATGIDGKSDPELAARWFESAAEYGMQDSQYNLGILYARGAGVDRDLMESFKWFAIVAAKGDSDAAAKRDEIRKSLNGEEVQQAEARVSSFKERPRNEAANTVDIPKSWNAPSSQTKTSSITPETSSVDMTRAIRNIQAILIKLGYEPGAPDGIIGDKTIQAIKAFQADSGLEATGQVDETLIRKLLERRNG
ncbi:peptidoglycan-binding protein [Jiella marina]|uniref:peptidoglycan-binding protein n=1 Tax=Jiella sp. LLJ827 TaxID=2917712 RepID=UPI002101B2B2|nr:peptidoglycan-binding protein [Jiella sp. LLJ827]MCQ0989948.1 peptidoglycan-binding protein [Jiella sp. LLJ827]